MKVTINHSTSTNQENTIKISEYENLKNKSSYLMSFENIEINNVQLNNPTITNGTIKGVIDSTSATFTGGTHTGSTFTNGVIDSSTIKNSTFTEGTLSGSIDSTNATFSGGTHIGSTFENGVISGGTITGAINSTSATFSGGTFTDVSSIDVDNLTVKTSANFSTSCTVNFDGPINFSTNIGTIPLTIRSAETTDPKYYFVLGDSLTFSTNETTKLINSSLDPLPLDYITKESFEQSIKNIIIDQLNSDDDSSSLTNSIIYQVATALSSSDDTTDIGKAVSELKTNIAEATTEKIMSDSQLKIKLQSELGIPVKLTADTVFYVKSDKIMENGIISVKSINSTDEPTYLDLIDYCKFNEKSVPTIKITEDLSFKNFVDTATNSAMASCNYGFNSNITFKTISKCIEYVRQNYNLTYSAYIMINEGIYTPDSPIVLSDYNSSGGSIFITGRLYRNVKPIIYYPGSILGKYTINSNTYFIKDDKTVYKKETDLIKNSFTIGNTFYKIKENEVYKIGTTDKYSIIEKFYDENDVIDISSCYDTFNLNGTKYIIDEENNIKEFDATDTKATIIDFIGSVSTDDYFPKGGYWIIGSIGFTLDSDVTVTVEDSVIKKGSIIAKNSVINGTKYKALTELNEDITVTNVTTSTSIIKSGSTIAIGSTINSTIYKSTLDSDVTVTVSGSVIKKGSKIAKNSVINGTTYTASTKLNEDIIVTNVTTSVIKEGSIIANGSVINGDEYNTLYNTLAKYYNLNSTTCLITSTLTSGTSNSPNLFEYKKWIYSPTENITLNYYMTTYDNGEKCVYLGNRSDKRYMVGKSFLLDGARYFIHGNNIYDSSHSYKSTIYHNEFKIGSSYYRKIGRYAYKLDSNYDIITNINYRIFDTFKIGTTTYAIKDEKIIIFNNKSDTDEAIFKDYIKDYFELDDVKYRIFGNQLRYTSSSGTEEYININGLNYNTFIIGDITYYIIDGVDKCVCTKLDTNITLNTEYKYNNVDITFSEVTDTTNIYKDNTENYWFKYKNKLYKRESDFTNNQFTINNIQYYKKLDSNGIYQIYGTVKSNKITYGENDGGNEYNIQKITDNTFTLDSDVTVTVSGSVIKKGSTIAKDSVINGTTYTASTKLNEDIIVTNITTSVIKEGSKIANGSVINDDEYNTFIIYKDSYIPESTEKNIKENGNITHKQYKIGTICYLYKDVSTNSFSHWSSNNITNINDASEIKNNKFTINSTYYILNNKIYKQECTFDNQNNQFTYAFSGNTKSTYQIVNNIFYDIHKITTIDSNNKFYLGTVQYRIICDSVINYSVPQEISYNIVDDTILDSDVTVTVSGSVIKKGSKIAKNSVINGTTYTASTKLNEDIIVTNITTSVIKEGSKIAKNSVINGTTYNALYRDEYDNYFLENSNGIRIPIDYQNLIHNFDIKYGDCFDAIFNIINVKYYLQNLTLVKHNKEKLKNFSLFQSSSVLTATDSGMITLNDIDLIGYQDNKESYSDTNSNSGASREIEMRILSLSDNSSCSLKENIKFLYISKYNFLSEDIKNNCDNTSRVLYTENEGNIIFENSNKYNYALHYIGGNYSSLYTLNSGKISLFGSGNIKTTIATFDKNYKLDIVKYLISKYELYDINDTKRFNGVNISSTPINIYHGAGARITNNDMKQLKSYNFNRKKPYPSDNSLSGTSTTYNPIRYEESTYSWYTTS